MTTARSPHEARDSPAVGVITVDDQDVFRRVAREVIDATPGFVSWGEAAGCEEAVSLAARVHPDLVLLDVRMPGADGLETARLLSTAHPDATIILISSNELDAAVAVLESCGAAAFMRKHELKPATLRRLWADHGRRSEPPPTR